MSVVPCTDTPPTLGLVVFDPVAFQAAYPEFATLQGAFLTRCFNQATLQLSNCCGSRVQDANQREILLDLLTAHIAALSPGGGVNGQPPAGIVGRVANAAEGSVSVGAEYSSNVSPSEAYYIQTQYGAQFWQATAGYRTMAYVPAPPSCGAGAYGPGNPGLLFGPGVCGYGNGFW